MPYALNVAGVPYQHFQQTHKEGKQDFRISISILNSHLRHFRRIPRGKENRLMVLNRENRGLALFMISVLNH